MENEKRARDLERQRLLQEREKIRIQRIQVLGKELQLLSEGKKDLRKNLINRRMEQVVAGRETPVQRQNRREELVDAYEKYAERLIPVVNEYWDIKKHNRRSPYELPVENPIDYSINYTAQQKWTEPEMMCLLFNIVELCLEPHCWEIMKKIQLVLRPRDEKEIDYQFSMIKRDWEQKHQTAVGWKGIAETAIQQQIDRENMDKILSEKKVTLTERQPSVVSPDEVKTPMERRESKEKRERDRRESPLTETRQVGKPNKLGVPSPKEMQKDREAALQAASIIAGNGNGNFKNGIKLPMEAVNAPEFIPKKKERQGGLGEKIVTSQPQPPPYYMIKEQFCENCQQVHIGHSCLCLICSQGGHWYYECPQRDLKEGTHKTLVNTQPVAETLCPFCHLNHKPPCTIGLKQHKQVQEAFSHRKGEEGGELVKIKPQGPTPFCMYCGQMNGKHGPECSLYESNGQAFSEACTFCGYYGHQADNCEARHREYQTQIQSGHLCSYCGSQNHVFVNCEKYKVILARQKQEIGQRNADRYMTAIQAAGEKPLSKRIPKLPPKHQQNNVQLLALKKEPMLSLGEQQEEWGVEVMNHLDNPQKLNLNH